MKKLLSLLLSCAIVLTCIGAISFVSAESTGAVNLISDAASTLEGLTSVPAEITVTAGLVGSAHAWRLSLANDATNGKVVWWRGSPNYTYAGPQWAYADNLNSYLAANDAEKYTVTISAKVKYMTDDGSGSASDKCLTFGFRSSSGMDNWVNVIGYNAWVDASATKELTKAEVQALTNSKLTFDGYAKAANSGTDKAVFFDSVQMTIEAVKEEVVEIPSTYNVISTAASTLEGLTSVPAEITVTASLVGSAHAWRLSLANDATNGKVVWWRGSPSYTYAGPQWAIADNLNSYLAANDAEKYTVTISAKVKYMTDDGSGSATDKCLTFGFRNSSGMSNWVDVIGYNAWVDVATTKVLTKAEVQALTNSKLTFDGYTKAANSGTDKAVFFDSVQMTIDKVEEETNITPVQKNIISDAASTLEGLTSVPAEITVTASLVGSAHAWRLSLANDATNGKVVWWRGSPSYTYAGPQWAIADNLNSYLAANDAEKYTVTISAKVKYMTDDGSGSATDKCLTFGFRSSSGMDNWVNVIGYNAWVDVATTKVLTKAEVQALTNSKLTFDGYTKAANSGTDKAVFFDSVQMTIINAVAEETPVPATPVPATPVPATPVPATPVPATPTPIGLLPVEISVFDVTGVSEHTHLIYKETAGHIYSKSVVDGALKVAYKAPAAKNNTPMWLLGSYIKNFATNNDANAYKVEVALDVKGAITSTDLIIRRFGDDNDATIKVLKEGVALNDESYTTISAVFYLDKQAALNAGDIQYALALNNIALKDALTGSWGTLNSVLFDNVVLKVTGVDKVEEVPLDEKFVTNGDAEDGLKNWSTFSSIGGKLELSTDTKSGTGYSVKYSTPYNKYGSIAFDLGPAIIEDAMLGYNGRGNGTYRVSFDLKASKDATITPVLNSQAHSSDPCTYANAKDRVQATTQWQSFTVEVDVTQEILDNIAASYKAGNTNAYQIVLRLDASASLFAENTEGVYFVDNVTIEYVEGSGEELDAYDELLSKANAVKYTINKDLWDGWIVTGNGIIDPSTVKDGYITKKFTITNTSKEEIAIRMYIQGAIKLPDGSTTWASPDGAWSELIVIPVGATREISAKVAIKNNVVDINYDGKTHQCDVSQLFVRFNFDKGIFAGNSFIVNGENSDVEKLLSFAGVDKDAWMAEPMSTSYATGDAMLIVPALLVAVIIPAFVFVSVKKKREQ